MDKELLIYTITSQYVAAQIKLVGIQGITDEIIQSCKDVAIKTLSGLNLS